MGSSWPLFVVMTSSFLLTCHRSTSVVARDPDRLTRSTVAVQKPTTASTPAPLKQNSNEHLSRWPIPHLATRITDQMWALTIEPSQSALRPRLHSNTVLVFSRTGYDISGAQVSNPFTGVAGIEYFTPRWQSLFLSMSAGEVKRVWLLDPGEPVLIFDVKLKNVLPVR